MYKLIAIAGTFDRLHKGHRHFISQAFKFGEKVIIGLTSDKYTDVKSQIPNPKSQINTKISTTNYQTRKRVCGEDTSGVTRRVYPVRGSPNGGGIRIKVNSFKERKKELEDFLSKEKLSDHAEIIKINDLYGPAIDPKIKIEALGVTKDSLKGAIEVNRKRKELKLKLLKLLKIPIIMAQDKKRIASTRIRMGEIDRFGKVFLQLVQNETGRNKFKPISEELRRELKKPQGVLIDGDINNLEQIVPKLKTLIRKLQPMIISTVGDEVTKVCNNAGLMPDLAIFDLKVNRIKVYNSYADINFSTVKPITRGTLANGFVIVRNRAGNISQSIVLAVEKAIKGIISDGRQRLIQVIGEDDLAAVPAILLSPLGSVVIYGQPGEGVVVVEVTEEKKEKMVKLLNC